MKVAILNARFQGGGAALAARRLWEAHRSQGIEAVFVSFDAPVTNGAVPTQSGWLEKKIGFARFALDRLWFFSKAASKEVRFAWSSGRFGQPLAKLDALKSADIIHLHWVNDGFLSLEGLAEISAMGKPIVWTFHDMWPMTGGCHYSDTCSNFERSCGLCPMLYKPDKHDLSAIQHQAKANLLSVGRWAGVGCSEWITSEAAKSSLWRGNVLRAIPNPIDTNFFKPGDKAALRTANGIDPDQKVLLFTAMSLHDKRKGLDLLVSALSHLKQINPEASPLLLIAGKSQADLAQSLPFNCKLMGALPPEKMVEIYSMADAMVLPSRQDNLPNTIMEALSCGLPVAAFQIGGIPEMLMSDKTGQLAKPFEPESLAHAIDLVLKNADQYSEACRAWVEQHYSYSSVSSRYQLLYQELLQKN